MRAPADHDGQLALEVGAGLLARDHDRLAMADQAGRELGEHDRHGGDVQLGLLGVVTIVEADRDDFARHDGMQQLHVGDGHCGAGGGGDRGPALDGRDEPLRPGDTGIDDRLVLQTSEANLAGCIPIAHCVHGVLRGSTEGQHIRPPGSGYNPHTDREGGR